MIETCTDLLKSVENKLKDLTEDEKIELLIALFWQNADIKKLVLAREFKLNATMGQSPEMLEAKNIECRNVLDYHELLMLKGISTMLNLPDSDEAMRKMGYKLNQKLLSVETKITNKL